MWHILFYSLSFFFSSLVFMFHPLQSRRAFMLSQNTLATVAKTGVKLKQGRAFWIHLILICIVWGIQIYVLSLLLTKDRQLYLMGQIFGDRQKETMLRAPSVKPCVLHVFVFLNSHIPNCQYVTYSLRPRFVFCKCSSLPRLLCMVASFKILIYIFIFYICCWY